MEPSQEEVQKLASSIFKVHEFGNELGQRIRCMEYLTEDRREFIGIGQGMMVAPNGQKGMVPLPFPLKTEGVTCYGDTLEDAVVALFKDFDNQFSAYADSQKKHVIVPPPGFNPGNGKRVKFPGV